MSYKILDIVFYCIGPELIVFQDFYFCVATIVYCMLYVSSEVRLFNLTFSSIASSQCSYVVCNLAVMYMYSGANSKHDPFQIQSVLDTLNSSMASIKHRVIDDPSLMCLGLTILACVYFFVTTIITNCQMIKIHLYVYFKYISIILYYNVIEFISNTSLSLVVVNVLVITFYQPNSGSLYLSLSSEWIDRKSVV